MSTPESGVSAGPNHAVIAARVVEGIQRHTQTAEGARAMVKSALTQVPGLEAVLFPALKEAQLAHAIPQVPTLAAEPN